ncbi:uncharacterized protein LOC122694586 isoform X2 [Cervus elaphus]|uniref:uncharacterized protein LOC122446754 isoform X2 n=1 Tax=Cervus canadensis TaxID=1574408 RepID=UPI001C9E2A9E|nr:uncharacterized protein LOC122446754 isoform X2 [Cervus canadensis]XP_043759436.1 uncharacterized protein LOC122694586 isoform X2 [Cervus elaphus]
MSTWGRGDGNTVRLQRLESSRDEPTRAADFQRGPRGEGRRPSLGWGRSPVVLHRPTTPSQEPAVPLTPPRAGADSPARGRELADLSAQRTSQERSTQL